jgi:hypothetical protein
LTDPNHLQVGIWRDNEFRTGQQRGTGRFGIQHGSGAQQYLVSQLVAYPFQNLDGFGHGEGDLHDIDATGQESLGDIDQQIATAGADHGDDSGIEHSG